MKILAVETSAAPASAALAEDGELLGEFYTRVKLVHSQTLMPMVGALLDACRVKIGEIGLFAVSAGPGSFTGVRIGVAAVKGMAFPNGTPCAAVSTLETIARSAPLFDGLVCAVMDARCGQVYNAIFEGDGGGLVRRTEDRAVSVAQLGEELALYKKRTILVGDGAELCYNLLNHERLCLAPENFRYQRASSVAALALRNFHEGRTVTAPKLAPVYLRRPQAERNRLLKKETTGRSE